MMVPTLSMTKAMPLGDMVFIIVAFLTLMVILKHVAYGPLTKALDARADKINNDLDSAQKANEDAAKLAAQREQELADGKDQASQVISAAKKSAKDQSEALLKTANDQALSLRKAAENDADQLKTEALASAKKDVADLSVTIASKLIQKNLSADDQRSLIDAYLADLDQQ
ncbi:F0F1 ATP synthase subunit B [Fructobacillus tropaeoli]|uniref:ATP synthase subunit b n=2 Tax=Fructobacillus tropaeoli TaxID=709323 RepID=A0A3F3H4D5_9LACO|nr:F0F1 ATP synthase subunit B [Fructobacillus tropaeoli]GAP04687.1 ATP synthase subunit b [Fructobacillus tropaeoli]GIC70398.1 F0F1 ATP synthase subunit B [Fructobacillus tropaeoli]